MPSENPSSVPLKFKFRLFLPASPTALFVSTPAIASFPLFWHATLFSAHSFSAIYTIPFSLFPTISPLCFSGALWPSNTLGSFNSFFCLFLSPRLVKKLNFSIIQPKRYPSRHNTTPHIFFPLPFTLSPPQCQSIFARLSVCLLFCSCCQPRHFRQNRLAAIAGGIIFLPIFWRILSQYFVFFLVNL